MGRHALYVNTIMYHFLKLKQHSVIYDMFIAYDAHDHKNTHTQRGIDRNDNRKYYFLSDVYLFISTSSFHVSDV